MLFCPLWFELFGYEGWFEWFAEALVIIPDAGFALITGAVLF